MCVYMCFSVTGFSNCMWYMSMYRDEGLHEWEIMLVYVSIHTCVLSSVCAFSASMHTARVINQRLWSQGSIAALRACYQGSKGICARETCEKAGLHLSGRKDHCVWKRDGSFSGLLYVGNHEIVYQFNHPYTQEAASHIVLQVCIVVSIDESKAFHRAAYRRTKQ